MATHKSNILRFGIAVMALVQNSLIALPLCVFVAKQPTTSLLPCSLLRALLPVPIDRQERHRKADMLFSLCSILAPLIHCSSHRFIYVGSATEPMSQFILHTHVLHNVTALAALAAFAVIPHYYYFNNFGSTRLLPASSARNARIAHWISHANQMLEAIIVFDLGLHRRQTQPHPILFWLPLIIFVNTRVCHRPLSNTCGNCPPFPEHMVLSPARTHADAQS